MSRDSAPARPSVTVVGCRNPQSAIRNPQSRRAFTLIELLLVVFIMGVLAALTIPTVASNLAAMHMDAAAERVLSACRRARAEATGSGLVHRLNINATTGEYWITVESDPLLAPGAFDRVTERWGRVQELPGSIAFAEAAAYPAEGAASKDSAEATVIDFFPDGTATDAIVALSYKDQANAAPEDQVILMVEAATGNASIITADERDQLEVAREGKM